MKFPEPKVEQFFRTYTISHFSVDKKESRLLFSSNLNGKTNLWAIDLNGSGFPYLFAQHDESANFIKFDPHNLFVLAGYDHDGDENYHIYSISPEGGFPQPLITGEPTDKFYYAHLNEDGTRLYYMTSEGNPSFLNTRVRNLEDGSDSLLTEGEGALTELAAVSEDENSFVYLHALANTYVKAVVETQGKTFSLLPDPEIVHIATNPIFTDNQTIYFLTDYESEYTYLARFDIETKTTATVLSITNESITHLEWDKKNNLLYLVTEKGVEDLLYRYALADEQLEPLSAPVDVIEQLSVTENGNLYLLGRSATLPGNIFTAADGKKWTQLTENRVLGISQKDMIEPDVITYSSFDGLDIEALLFRAKEEQANGYTIFWPHGGPQASERKQFRAMFQCFLNRGYNIFAPNFRGSTGYGSSFVKLVEQDWGGAPRMDNVAGIEWLIKQNITKPEKLFLVGGSYGGYMALLLHGRHPEYFKAVIDIFGPSDLFSFVQSVPPHWKPIMERWVGDPERDKERFIEDSPVTYLDSMTKPMLVIQGAKDPRVIKAESDQIVAKLEETGREVDYLVLEDEGHGFSKKENEIKVYNQMLEFMEKHQS